MLFATDDEPLQNVGRYLLQRCLAESTHRELRQFKIGNDYLLAFRKFRDQDVRTWKYVSAQNQTVRDVVGCNIRANGEKLFRHVAFVPRFDRIGDSWVLEISPTYVFTTDGSAVSQASSNWTAGKKALEHNESVRNNVIFWWKFLNRQDSLFDETYRHLRFGSLLGVSSTRGLFDEAWHEPTEEEAAQVDRDSSTEDLWKLT